MLSGVGAERYCRGNDDGVSEVGMAKDDGGQQRATRRTQETEEVEETESSDVAERQEKLSEDVDDILDEIDSVLEENAEDFVRSYVQKGGE
jgi:ubiquitin-like protein Pup